jgi:hypothetical protein
MVKPCSVSRHLWCEIDFAMDLARAEALFGKERKDDVQPAPFSSAEAQLSFLR